ncbi:MAG: ATP-binding protein [Tenuifilaceae bacterium]|jgi:signal transduction histidine kinase|nr:ATP-binding protein [Bacteroidales bacterium]MDI9517278.1 ATP-binding protein [Bacteroidota bacterium]NLH55466.1 hybrid sensor histidine kinase/response regulator [Rikenellaceae bacterium]OQC62783.1 MAG: Alkaline phosphatase synthesis sensor protein PhoR [Bacteroidetes bacterium ADurb.Bin008]HNV81888.1 ATP-binding protein [Tenuifilaceae bacterium]
MSAINLLVVDDEPGIRGGVVRILRNFSVSYPFMEEEFTYEVMEAETGEKAIEIIDSSSIDVVLLDNKLPGIQGIEVLEYITGKEYDISVIMITSYASLDLAVKATNMGAYSFVPKPFTPQELRASIESVTKNLFLKRMTRQMRMEGKQNQYQFLSVLSHELKSPINAVEGYIRIMLEKQVGDSIDDYRTMLERSLERLKGMRTLILDLIDITRIETGKKARDVRNIDLYEIAKRVVDTVEPLAIQKSVKMHMDVQENTFIKADSHEMEIILNNFISNAVKYNKDGGEVFFSIKKTADNYVITVEDTGIGISEEEQKLLFQEFVRIKNPQTKNITGSGLGLSIAKKMVDLYHGTIEVQSTPGEGSIFTVKLPAN